jgi:hypothetical protein
MPDREAHPPEESLRPEYAGGNVHPHARAADRTEPWLVATAGFLADQDFDHDFATGRRYDAPSMVRAFVYKRLVDISSFHRLTSHLTGNPRVRQALGFSDEVPAGDTFREWWKNRLDEQQREVTEDVADTIMAPRLGRILLDLGLPEGKRFFHIPEPEPDPIEITPEQKQDAIEHIRPMVYGDLDFDRADNREYDASQLLDYQAEVSEDQDYIQKTLEEKDDHGEDPISPRGYFGAVENRDAGNWERQFREAYDKQLQAAKGAGMFDRPVPVYIDGTIRPFYKRNAGLAEGVRGGEPKNGTYYGYHHITISAHADGRSILLATYQFTPGDTMQEAVKYLIREAEKHVSIEEIAMDSAFRKVEMLQWLDDRGHVFTIQFPKNGERVKLALAQMESEYDYVEEYYVQSSDKKTRLDDLTLVAEPDYNNVDGNFDFSTNATAGQRGLDDFGGGLDMESASLEDIDDRLWKGRRAYLTNKNVEDKDDAERIIKRYDQRWTIETKYRVIKNEFLGKTTSRKFSVRTFFWLFACMFYNAWVLLDVFLRADHPDLAPEDRPVMPARSFAREFFKVDYG